MNLEDFDGPLGNFYRFSPQLILRSYAPDQSIQRYLFLRSHSGGHAVGEAKPLLDISINYITISASTISKIVGR